MIEDVSREFEKLRETAHALKLPNADKINWTLIASSTSDSASTQKRFNKLAEEKRAEDEVKFGKASPEAFELVENFCSMHLGINLRKAFLDGIKQSHVAQQGNIILFICLSMNFASCLVSVVYPGMCRRRRGNVCSDHHRK